MARLGEEGDTEHDMITKAELVEAHRGDFHLFEKIDTEKNGKVSREQWHAYLRKTVDEKNAKDKKGHDKGKDRLESAPRVLTLTIT